MSYLLGLTGLLLVNFTGAQVDFYQAEYELSQVVDTTQCEIPLRNLAYAFALKETGNGKTNNYNNLFGLRYGKATTKSRPKFASYDEHTHSQNGYNRYDNRVDNIYDFMYQFNSYGCKLTKNYVHGHLHGPRGPRDGVDLYYNQIIGYSKLLPEAEVEVEIGGYGVLQYYALTKELKDMGYKINNMMRLPYQIYIISSNTKELNVRYDMEGFMDRHIQPIKKFLDM